MGPSAVRKPRKWIKIEDGRALMESKAPYKNIVFSDGETKLLDYISSMGNAKTFKNFLQKIEINTSIPSDSPLWPGSTPLHLAVMSSENAKSEEKASHVVKQLLDQGAVVQIQDCRGATPLHLAFRLSQQKILLLLLRNLETESLKVSNLLDNKNLSFLHIALTTSDHRSGLAGKLLSEPAIESSVNIAYKGKSHPQIKQGWTPLHVAVDKCQIHSIELLFQRGAKLLSEDSQGYTVIHWLFGTNAKSLADTLFACNQLKECMVQANGMTHLHVAVWFNDFERTEQLLDLGADIEATLGILEGENLQKFCGCTPLRIAMMMDHKKIVKLLVKRGADVLAQKPDGTSPLSEILQGNRLHREGAEKVLLQLIWNDKKLQKYLKKELGLTMLHIACNSIEEERVEELLKKGADVNAKLHDDSHFWPGYTPLHVLVASNVSCWKDRNVILTNLWNNGCDIDQQDSSGQTALHLVYRQMTLYKVKDTASLLLATGADINIVDKNGKTALSYALEINSNPSGFNYRSELDSFRSIICDIILHVHRMNLLKLEVSELNRTLAADPLQKYNILTPNNWIASFQAFYEQVEAAEKIEIGHCGLNVRSFLCETGGVRRYPSLTPKHRGEVAAFSRSFIDENFSDVIPLFRLQHRKAVARVSLMNPARYALKALIDFGFPDLCVDIIVKRLSNSQLKALITAASRE